MYLGEEDAARAYRKKGTRHQPRPAAALPEREEPGTTRIIVLASPCGGNSPITRFLSKGSFRTFYTVPDFFEASMSLPPHHLLINAIGDADSCGSSLRTAGRVLEKSKAPILNPPRRVHVTGRADNARLLGTLEGIVTPRIASIPRETLAGPKGIPLLEEQGFAFPLLLRTPGFHGGGHFLRIETPDALAPGAASLPGQRLMAIEYLNARDADGKIRKYRVMMIDGKLHPLHKAVSSNWMIHYFSAEMADSPAHRAEDQRFLEDMPGALGPKAVAALERLRDALGLDYAGADFSLDSKGEILLFEANATMAIPLPNADEKWDYRRAPVLRLHQAVREMILTRAGPVG